MCGVTGKVVDRFLGFMIGSLTFVAAHFIEVAMWSIWFGGAHEPWFLNSGRAIVFTLACQFGASLIAGILRLRGLAIAVGGVTAMTIVLAAGGGSTIFPIVLTAGGLFIATASWLGAWLGSEIASFFSSTPK
jgi:hypothetical protein